MALTIKTEDHTKEVIRTKDEAIAKALEMMGLQAESYTKLNLRAVGAVDTGLLRNSITHAVSGGPTAISSYSADKPKKGQKSSGSYGGSIGSEREEAVYVGTNVEYAPYIEYGTSRNKGPRPYLKPAINDHIEEYKRIATQCLNEIK